MQLQKLIFYFTTCVVIFFGLFVSGNCFGQGTRADRLRDKYIHKDKDDANRIWIMAHRGVWDETNPESSLGAFKNAVNCGFEMIELDVRFSHPYDMDNLGSCISKNNGKYRSIIFCHDVSPDRTDGYGLFKYDGVLNFDDKAKNDKGFIVFDNLVPYNYDNRNSFLYTSISQLISPEILTLEGKPSGQHLLYYNPTDAKFKISNPDMEDFVKSVKGRILINLDKMASKRDFQEVYDFMEHYDLLDQCVFKAKDLRDFAGVKELFGEERINKGHIIFTPIFTQYDNKFTGDYATNLAALKNCMDDMIANESDLIHIAGAEIIYQDDLEKAKNAEFGFLTELADYVNAKGKRVIQFGVVPENKLGAWTGNSCKWNAVRADQQNFWWPWLFDNPKLVKDKRNAKASVFVGDKPLELRNYLFTLGYTQTIID